MAGGTEPAEPQLGASPGFRGRGCPRTRGAEEEAGGSVGQTDARAGSGRGKVPTGARSEQPQRKRSGGASGLAVVYWFKANYLLQDAAFHTQTGTIS